MTPGRRTVLIGGGACSGKTAFALERARRLGRRRVYLATAQEGDAEMARRIAAHRAERGTDFRTVEEPLHLLAALSRLNGCDVAVVDCLTLWLSNLLLRKESPAAALAEAEQLARAAAELPFHVLFVTNEVGMGIVPDTRLGRMFREVSGSAHQRLARAADEVYFGALGQMLRLRPGPVQAITEYTAHASADDAARDLPAAAGAARAHGTRRRDRQKG